MQKDDSDIEPSGDENLTKFAQTTAHVTNFIPRPTVNESGETDRRFTDQPFDGELDKGWIISKSGND